MSGREQAGANDRMQVGLTDSVQTRCGIPKVSKRHLLSLIAFMLRFRVKEKERLASISVLSPRATQQASCSLVNTETELGGRGNEVTTLGAERCRRRRVDPRRRRAAGA